MVEKSRRSEISRRRLLGLLATGGTALVMTAAPRGQAHGDGGLGPPSSSGSVRPGPGSLSTRLTEQFGVRYPFVSAGMAFVGLPPLVTAVCNAGGIGMLGASPEPPPVLEARIQAIKAATSSPFGVNFIIDTGASGPFTTRDHIDVCIAEAVKLVTFHWNIPESRWVSDLQSAGAQVWMQAGSMDFALQGLEVGADGIIAQGREAGGHNRSTVRATTLLQELRAVAPPEILVIAAGGIADGVAVARALRSGADAVWVGTRLVASVEAYAHPGYKERLVSAQGRATAVTTIFGPEWPGQRQRVLRTRVVDASGTREADATAPPPSGVIGTTVLFPGVLNVPYEMPRFSAVVPTPETIGDLEQMDLPAGSESVKHIKAILPAGEIVTGMMEHARSILERRVSSSPLHEEHLRQQQQPTVDPADGRDAIGADSECMRGGSA